MLYFAVRNVAKLDTTAARDSETSPKAEDESEQKSTVFVHRTNRDA